MTIPPSLALISREDEEAMSKPNNKNMLDMRNELIRLYAYDPSKGKFINKFNRGKSKKGKSAGTYDKKGYLTIAVCKRSMFVHRLAWLYMYGYLPENILDHIDRNRANNRIENLREVTNSCNMKNQKISIRNKSGVIGVKRSGRRWHAYITSNDVTHKLGIFDNIDDAVRARWEGERKHGFSDCCVGSSAYKYLNDNNLL